jgi:hypothetical protein
VQVHALCEIKGPVELFRDRERPYVVRTDNCWNGLQTPITGLLQGTSRVRE